MLRLADYTHVRYDDNHYNCLHFAVDIYRDITGVDMGVFVGELMTGRDKRVINPAALKNFVKLAQPCDPCLAVMRGQTVHAGIYHAGRIIHLTHHGIHSVPPHIASLEYASIDYYRI